MLGFGGGKWACSVSQLFCLFTSIFLCKMQLFFKICKTRRALKRKSCESIWQPFSPWIWLQFWSLSFVCQSCIVDHLHPIWLFVYLVWRLSETSWFLTSKSSYRFVTFWIETVCRFESMAHSQSWRRNWCWSLDLCGTIFSLAGFMEAPHQSQWCRGSPFIFWVWNHLWYVSACLLFFFSWGVNC